MVLYEQGVDSVFVYVLKPQSFWYASFYTFVFQMSSYPGYMIALELQVVFIKPGSISRTLELNTLQVTGFDFKPNCCCFWQVYFPLNLMHLKY